MCVPLNIVPAAVAARGGPHTHTLIFQRCSLRSPPHRAAGTAARAPAAGAAAAAAAGAATARARTCWAAQAQPRPAATGGRGRGAWCAPSAMLEGGRRRGRRGGRVRVPARAPRLPGGRQVAHQPALGPRVSGAAAVTPLPDVLLFEVCWASVCARMRCFCVCMCAALVCLLCSCACASVCASVRVCTCVVVVC